MTAHQVTAGMTPSHEERLQRVLLQFEWARIVLCEGQPVGLLKVRREGRTWDLVQIQLHPSLQGQGIGTALLRSLVQEAHSANVGLRLAVLKENPARRLYERLGFRLVAEEAHGYEMALGA